jgi:hypothetical protein
VATVEITPATPIVAVGGSYQLTAVTRDASGNVLNGRAVAWSSSDPSVATVDGNGLVSGIADGSATVTATSEGQSGTASVTVVTWTSNEPPGFTTFSDREYVNLGVCYDGSSQEEGWNEDEGCYGGNLTIVQMSDAPVSPPGVLQFRYPTGFEGGSSPGNSRLPFSSFDNGGYQKMYFRYAFRISDNFFGHDSGINKLQHIWITVPVKNRIVPLLFGQGTDQLRYMMALQGDPDQIGRLGANQTGVSDVINRGQWYVLEMLLELNTPGVANGVLKYWIDGTLVGSYDSVKFLGSGEPTGFYEFMHGPTWGGIAYQVPSTMYLWFDHTYVSGAP